jgi:dual specificity protein kinase YAK1
MRCIDYQTLRTERLISTTVDRHLPHSTAHNPSSVALQESGTSLPVPTIPVGSTIMSEPELYMPDSNESFDLPRWQTQVDPLSSTAQAAHVAQASYHYSGPPPPPPPQASSQRQGPTRQPRISQLLGQEQQMAPSLSPYSSSGQSQLARSASLGGNAVGNVTSSRVRRHHPSDDLEGAFNVDNQGMVGPRQQPQLSHNTYYSSGVGYQPPSLTRTGSVNPAASPTDPYSDMYYNGSASHPPKRLLPGQHDLNTSSVSRGGRSPLRVPNTPISNSPLDQYSNQPQYSPTTASYPYSNAVDQRTHPATYQSHSRNHSQVKNESLTPPIPASYSSPATNLSPPNYSSNMSTSGYQNAYSMDTSSPHPPMASHLSTQGVGIKASHSNPTTPLSYMHPNMSQGSHYYPQDQAMAIDSPPKRRAPGFRRIRTQQDLQPRLDIPPTGRRMGADGQYLSVSSNFQI